MANVTLSSILRSSDERAPTSINGWVATSSALTGIDSIVSPILSGSLSAGTYKDVLTVTDPGVLKLLVVRENGSSPGDSSIKVTINGVVAMEKAYASAVFVAGSAFSDGTNLIGMALDRIPFDSLTVAVKTLTATTDVLTVSALYDLT